jgi:hypothetical protein
MGAERLFDRAAEHQQQLDVKLKYLTPAKLAARWDVCETTVRDIPRDLLPYLELGKGVKYKRRRYNPVDVLAYEARGR